MPTRTLRFTNTGPVTGTTVAHMKGRKKAGAAVDQVSSPMVVKESYNLSSISDAGTGQVNYFLLNSMLNVYQVTDVGEYTNFLRWSYLATVSRADTATFLGTSSGGTDEDYLSFHQFGDMA